MSVRTTGKTEDLSINDSYEWTMDYVSCGFVLRWWWLGLRSSQLRTEWWEMEEKYCRFHHPQIHRNRQSKWVWDWTVEQMEQYSYKHQPSNEHCYLHMLYRSCHNSDYPDIDWRMLQTARGLMGWCKVLIPMEGQSGYLFRLMAVYLLW